MDERIIMSKLNRVLGTIHGSYAAIAQKYGLTYNALLLFYIIGENDNVTQKLICDSLCLSKSTIHSTLSDLLKRGYVMLMPGGNKKEKYIVLTEAGTLLAQQIQTEVILFEKTVLRLFGKASTWNYSSSQKFLLGT